MKHALSGEVGIAARVRRREPFTMVSEVGRQTERSVMLLCVVLRHSDTMYSTRHKIVSMTYRARQGETD